MRKVSSFFPAVSKELHVSLSNVENVKEMEKMEVLSRKFRERSSILITIELSLHLEIQKSLIRITAMLKRVKILQQFKRNILQQLHHQ